MIGWLVVSPAVVETQQVEFTGSSTLSSLAGSHQEVTSTPQTGECGAVIGNHSKWPELTSANLNVMLPNGSFCKHECQTQARIQIRII